GPGAAERRRLAVVELERGPGLACEPLPLAARRFCRALVDVVGGRDGPCRCRERDRSLDPLGLGRFDLEGALEGAGEVSPAPIEHARELADASVRDCDGRPVVTDRHGDPGGGVALPPRERLATDRANARACLDLAAD